MRRSHLYCLLAAGLALSATACSDDDNAGSNNNNNTVELCGNGAVDPGEECDGSDLGGATCESLGMTGTGLACTSGCTFDRTGCEGCGNGQVELGEVCDGSDLDGQTCADLGFAGGTLACASDCQDYDTSDCDPPTTVCEADEILDLDVGTIAMMHVDTNGDDDSVDVSCENEPGTPDHLVAINVASTGDLVVTYPSDWHVFALFTEPSSPSGCYTSEISCLDPYEVGNTLVWAGLTPGTYYLAISDWNTQQSLETDYWISLYAAGAEICNNSADDDGDGDVDCDDVDCAGAGFCAAEICDNGTDDNYDGVTDCLAWECIGQAGCTGGGCTADTDLGTITSTQSYPVSFTTAGESDSYDLSCGSAGAGDYVVAFTLANAANVAVDFTQSAAGANVIGFFFEGGAGRTCVEQEYFCFEPTDAALSGNLTGEPLPPGNYYFIVEAAAGGGQVDLSLSVTLVCPAGQHDEAGACVWDTCADIDCAAMNMDCNDTPTPSVCEGCLAGYDPGYGRCIVGGSGYGDPCEKAADCPGTGTPGADVFCTTSTGGYCYAIDVPECATPGQPCTDDAGSICVEDSNGTRFCIAGCTDDTDCRPGYQCEANVLGTTYSACNTISHCDLDGCNDAGGTLYCDAANSDPDSRLCWVDACASNPCAAVANSNGTCVNDREEYSCECDAGFIWTAATGTCEPFVCGAVDLGTWAGTAIQQTVNSCTQDSTWSYSPADITCTGYAASAQEVVFTLVVPAGQTIHVTMTPDAANSQDSSLYLIDACDDFTATSCLAGADDTVGGDPETVTYTNGTGADLTVFIVADSYSGCGALTLSVAP